MTGKWSTVKQILGEAQKNDIAGESAKIAYYLLLSVFPFLITVFALTGLFGGQVAFDLIMREVSFVLPGEIARDLGGWVEQITGQERPGLLSLGLLMTFWSASNILVALVNALNRIYHVSDPRVWWRQRLMSLGVVMTASILLTSGAGAILAMPLIAFRWGLARHWEYLRWPGVFLLIAALLWLVYYLLPNLDQSHCKRELFFGAGAGSLLWTLGTALFQIYISEFGDYGRVYGFMGGVIVLLLWFYMTALSLLLGGEVSAALCRHRKKT